MKMKYVLIVIFVLTINLFGANGYEILDSLYEEGQYNNLYEVCKKDKDIDKVNYLYYCIGLYHLDKNRLLKEIKDYDFDKLTKNNIVATIELEKYNLSEAKKGFQKSLALEFNDLWSKCRIWEIELLEKRVLPNFSSSFAKKYLMENPETDKIEKMICYYAEKKYVDVRRLVFEITQEGESRYFLHLANYLINKRDKNYFQMDFEYQNLWKNKNHISNQFYNYLDRYLHFLIKKELKK